jgi:crossover junction endodeoxyribonuclease RuvC
MIVGAVDPGLGGGLAVVNSDGGCETILMPLTDDEKMVDGAAVMRFFVERNVEFVCIERTQSMPRQGVASTFKFGFVSGQVAGVTQVMMVPHLWITPQAWKKGWNLIKQDKIASNVLASTVFPRAAGQFKRVKDNGRAEAALIAGLHLGMHLNREAA